MEIHKNFNLRNFHTFHLDVTAREAVFVSTIADLSTVLEQTRNEQRLILGGGSNVLFTMHHFNGVVIFIRLNGIEVIDSSEETETLKAAAGEAWDDFVDYTVKRNLYGIENLSLIPGSVGASPIQNIGAYGQEVEQTIQAVEYLDIVTSEQKVLSGKDCKFGYRTSIFKNELKDRAVVTAVTYCLKKNAQLNTSYGAVAAELNAAGIANPGPADVRKVVMEIRQSKLPDPELLGNAGSFFKNPIITGEQKDSIEKVFGKSPAFAMGSNMHKMPAGWLMEKCGWKGKRVGNAGFYEKQALSLVNYGNATPDELIKVYKLAQDDVFRKTGIFLSPEVNLV